MAVGFSFLHLIDKRVVLVSCIELFMFKDPRQDIEFSVGGLLL